MVGDATNPGKPILQATRVNIGLEVDLECFWKPGSAIGCHYCVQSAVNTAYSKRGQGIVAPKVAPTICRFGQRQVSR
jgi:hypothetical protein